MAARARARGRSWCREFSLLWLFPLAVLGYRLRFDEQATPPLPPSLRASNLVPRAHALWAHEKKRKRKFGLVRVLAKLSWPFLVMGGIMSVVQGLATAVARPLLIRALISELERGQDRDDATLLTYVALLAAALLLEGYSSVSLKHALSDFLGPLWFTTAGALIQRQALSIPGGVTSIQESSLLGNDLMRTFENLKFMCLLPMSLVALAGGISVLIVSIGKASVVGLCVMVAILAVNGRLAHLAQIAEEQDLDASDARLSLLSQVISSIKAIKLSAWEDSFGELVKQARVVEMACLARYRTLSQSGVQLGRATPTVCAAVSFIYMVSVSESVNAADVFAALNVFLNLRLPLILIPECITYLGALQITLRRLDRYLRLDPVEAAKPVEDGLPADAVPEVLRLRGSFAWHGGMVAQEMLKQEEGADHASASPTRATAAVETTMPGPEETSSFTSSFTAFMLQDLDVELPRGSRCAVLGEVGSGKSSLLAAVLGELKGLALPGSVSAPSNDFGALSKAFVPQASFVISGTIRENLLFGLPDPRDDSFFEPALRRSALWDDLQRFPHGLDTAVGERGVTLSGGQKARLAVARALYATPQLYVFDDVLAAVDAPICRHLIEHVFEGVDEGATLIASINQYAFLGSFTHFIWLGKNGRVKRQGQLTPELVEEIQREMERFSKSLDDEPAQAEGGDVNKAEGDETANAAAHPGAEEDFDLVDREPSILSTGSRRQSSAVPGDRQGGGGGGGGGDDDDDDSKVSDDLVKMELRTTGSISWRVISAYARGMGYVNIVLACICGICAYASMALGDLWLASYLRTSGDADAKSNLFFALVYGAACVAFLLFLMLTSGIFSYAGVRASQGLHDKCMEKVLHAPISWFEATPSGRILSRFSTDIGIVDQQLSRFSDNLFQLSMTTLALIVVVVALVPPVLAAVAVSAVLYSFQVVAVDRTNREVKRSANMAMSPVQTIVNESVQGRLSLRAFSSGRGADEQATMLYFQEKFWAACDGWNRPSFISLSLVNFSMLLAYFISFIISTSVGVVIVLDKDLDPSSAALSLTYSLLVSYFGLHAAFIYSIVKVSLASLERVLEFVSDDVPQEPEWRLPDDPMTLVRLEKERLFTEERVRPSHKRIGDLEEGPGASSPSETTDTWPHIASINFVDVGLVYRPGLPFSLRHVSFDIESQERVAIVGKSGAGKSSIIGLLFRVYPLTEGKIIIGGRDIGSLGLVTLREAFSVIPQEPMLLAGTVRKNLDPFGAYEQSDLINALLQSGIAQSREIAEELLEIDIGDNASALSAGQRQLLSFARIILQPRPIIVCDEPTSFLDEASDTAVQRVLRSLPGTKLMIAHRLNTIVSSDKIIVMDKGRVSEIGAPASLLKKPHGLFRKMAVAANLQHEALDHGAQGSGKNDM